MTKLLNPEDNKKFNGKALAKNAMFYKDLLAFYDAYENLMSKETSTLPNYCFWNGSYCLEGICLFMKDYSGELGFESLKLDLDYLKLLYYTIAGYSDDDTLVPREVFAEEFEKYKTLSSEATKSAMDERYKLESEAGRSNRDYQQKSHSNIKNKTLSGTFNFLSIFFLLLGIFCVIAPLTFYFLDTLELVISLIISAVCVVVGVVLFIVFKHLSRKFDSKETGTAYELQRSKQSRDESMKCLDNSYLTFIKLQCEKYECQNHLGNLVFKDKKLSFDEIFARARDYSVLSYNIKRDCILMFESQQKEIYEILSMLLKAEKSDDTAKALSEVYRKIEEKDWLLYNNLVRFAFLNTYIIAAEKSYNWELGTGKDKFVPFGVDTKKIAKEQVAFLKNRNSLFVASSIDQLEKSNYLKRQDVLKIKRDLSADEVRELKATYIAKFFDYNKVKNYNNIFYDKKIGTGAKVPEIIIEKYSRIPILVYIKIRLLENKTGLDNADSGVIKKITEELFAGDKLLIEEYAPAIKPIDIALDEEPKKTIFECDETIEIDEYKTKYVSGDNSFVGYKVS